MKAKIEAQAAAMRDALQAWKTAIEHCSECGACGADEDCGEMIRLWDEAIQKTEAAQIGEVGKDILDRLESIRELCEDGMLPYNDLVACCAELTHWERPYVVPGEEASRDAAD